MPTPPSVEDAVVLRSCLANTQQVLEKTLEKLKHAKQELTVVASERDQLSQSLAELLSSGQTETSGTRRCLSDKNVQSEKSRRSKAPWNSSPIAHEMFCKILPCVDQLYRFTQEELPEIQKVAAKEPGAVRKIPLCLIRWTHDKINSHMVYSNGRREGSSMYELLHDLISGRQDLDSDSFPPLQVVVDRDMFYSLSNRRTTVLQMFQATRRHQLYRVRCELYSPKHPKVVSKYASAKTTTSELGMGLGVLLWKPREEAHHMGVPLFRRPGEWCDSQCIAHSQVPPQQQGVEAGAATSTHSALLSSSRVQTTEACGSEAPPASSHHSPDLHGAESQLIRSSSEHPHPAAPLEQICSPMGHNFGGISQAVVTDHVGIADQQENNLFIEEITEEQSDAGDESWCRSDSEDDMDEIPVEDPEEVIMEYEPLDKLQKTLDNQRPVERIQDLKNIVIGGTFRCASGSDFKNRRCRGEVLVEAGPVGLKGCSVQIIGVINRNRAWHCDRCFVRILRAKVGQVTSLENPEDKWNDKLKRRTTLYGRVVHAHEFGCERQKQLVCLRSRIVRSMKSMTFRPMNGKFPLVQVTWSPTQEVPKLHDLHVIEIVDWNNYDRPRGRYVYNLSESYGHKDTHASLLQAVRISVNLCDWEHPLGTINPDVKLQAHLRATLSASLNSNESSRRDLRGHSGKVLSIQRTGVPINMAFSTFGNSLFVHVVDVNAYIDSIDCQAAETSMRKRAMGCWLTDFRGEWTGESLPLLPKEFEEQLGFRVGMEQLALTFEFQQDEFGNINTKTANHFESMVKCDRLFTFEEAEDELQKHNAPTGSVTYALKAAATKIDMLEKNALERGESFAILHLEPNLLSRELSQGGNSSVPMSKRIMACLTFLVNSYAGHVLARPELWRAVIQHDDDQRGEHAVDSLVPKYLHGNPSPFATRVILRLMMQQFDSKSCPDEVLVKDIVRCMRKILSNKDLSLQQRQCLQSSFIPKLRNVCPYAGYFLVDAAASHPIGEKRAGIQGSLFSCPNFFHVDAPLSRYMDILAHRALKCASGTRPICAHMKITKAELEVQCVRHNARHEAFKAAAFIFRKVSLMRDLERRGRIVQNALVGTVGPSYFDVLIPASGGFVHEDIASVMLTTSVLRGATCMPEYIAESQTLQVSCFDSQESMPPAPKGRLSWKIEPWATAISCVLVRNFAQPVSQHASANAFTLADVTFQAKQCGRSINVTIGVKHRIFPEVFSAWPDLRQWHRMDSDTDAYAETWHSIRECELHAAASTSAFYTPRMWASNVAWYDDRNGRCSCEASRPSAHECAWMPSRHDLVVLRFRNHEGEAILHGRLIDCKAKGTQYRTKLCNIENCRRAQCQFAHHESELQQIRVTLDIQLSEVAICARRHQQRFLARSDLACDVQCINVSPIDRMGLDRLRWLPRFIKENPDSPVVSYLTGVRSPQEKQHELEQRPLATQDQVDRALQFPDFAVVGRELNAEQTHALKRGLQRPLSVVQGPPGTGKTTFLVHLVTAIMNLETDPTLEGWTHTRSKKRLTQQQDSFGKILVCTPSNQAADEVLQRLISNTRIPHKYITRVYARSIEATHGSKYKGGISIDNRAKFTIATNLQEHSLHFKTQVRPDVAKLKDKLPSDKLDPMRQKEFDAAYERAECAVLRDTRILVTTCASACYHSALNEGKDKMRTFTTVIVDEAAQGSEPDTILPALLAEQRLILIGDHKQLGPVVPENNLCSAYLCALETPLLERLYQTPERLPSNTMLKRQYRMHPTICSFPSRQYYGSQLADDECTLQSALPSSIWPVKGEHKLWVDCHSTHNVGITTEVGHGRSLTVTAVERNTSLRNAGEAALVEQVYLRLLKSTGCTPSDIGVITPYKAQQEDIRGRLQRKIGRIADNTAVGTVHALQGAERDYTIISLVRSKAEDLAMQESSFASAASDIVVSVDAGNPAIQQMCEGNIGIVGNAKLLNVALTRAKRGLIIIGNAQVLSEGSKDFFDLVRDYKDKGCMLTEEEFINLPRNGQTSCLHRQPVHGTPSGSSAAPQTKSPAHKAKATIPADSVNQRMPSQTTPQTSPAGSLPAQLGTARRPSVPVCSPAEAPENPEGLVEISPNNVSSGCVASQVESCCDGHVDLLATFPEEALRADAETVHTSNDNLAPNAGTKEAVTSACAQSPSQRRKPLGRMPKNAKKISIRDMLSLDPQQASPDLPHVACPLAARGGSSAAASDSAHPAKNQTWAERAAPK